MQIDIEYLRRHYASLSDEALLAIDRGELVETAQACYDEELARREPRPDTGGFVGLHMSGALQDRRDDEDDKDGEPGVGARPKWLEQAACVGEFVPYPNTDAVSLAATAHDVLLAAGIPCYFALEKIVPESHPPEFEYRVLVPGALTLHAVSVLDREVFNPRVEATWRTHLEALSDEQLRALNLESLCAGMLDRIERLRRVYNHEIACRGPWGGPARTS